MRLFSALVPPHDVLDELDTALEPRADGVRWIPRSAWHITLAFYGDDDLDRRDAALTSAVAGASSVDVGLAGAGTFRGVLWAGVDGDLTTLAAACGASGRFRPHLTVARWKPAPAPRTATEGVRRLRAWRSRLWRADEVVLMSSALSRRGAVYTARRRYRLR